MEKVLIMYYSISNGNTKRIATALQQKLGGTLVAIKTTIPYTGSYTEIVNQGNREVQAGYEPPIQPLTESINDYDTIIIGTPTWWYTMAPAVKTFLHHQDWRNKRVILFQTHGGWPGYTLQDMKRLCKGATVLSMKEIQFDSTGGSELITSEGEIEQWLEELKSK